MHIQYNVVPGSQFAPSSTATVSSTVILVKLIFAIPNATSRKRKNATLSIHIYFNQNLKRCNVLGLNKKLWTPTHSRRLEPQLLFVSDHTCWSSLKPWRSCLWWFHPFPEKQLNIWLKKRYKGWISFTNYFLSVSENIVERCPSRNNFSEPVLRRTGTLSILYFFPTRRGYNYNYTLWQPATFQDFTVHWPTSFWK